MIKYHWITWSIFEVITQDQHRDVLYVCWPIQYSQQSWVLGTTSTRTVWFTQNYTVCKQQSLEWSCALSDFIPCPSYHHAWPPACHPDCHYLHLDSTSQLNGSLTVPSHVPCISVSTPVPMLFSSLENSFPYVFPFEKTISFLWCLALGPFSPGYFLGLF